MNNVNIESFENMFLKLTKLFPDLYNPKAYFDRKSLQKNIKECKKTYETLNQKLAEIESSLNGKIKYTPMVSGNIEEIAERKAIPKEQKGFTYLLEEKTDLRYIAIKNMHSCNYILAQYHSQLCSIEVNIDDKISEYYNNHSSQIDDESKIIEKQTLNGELDEAFDKTIYIDDCVKKKGSDLKGILGNERCLEDIGGPMFDKRITLQNIGDYIDLMKYGRNEELSALKDKIYRGLRSEINEAMIDGIKPLLDERNSLKKSICQHEELLSDYYHQIILNDELVKIYDQSIDLQNLSINGIKKQMNNIQITLEKLERIHVDYNSKNISRSYTNIADKFIEKMNMKLESIMSKNPLQ